MHSQPMIYYTLLQHNEWKCFIAATSKGLCYVGTEHLTFQELEQWCNKHFPTYKLVNQPEQLQVYIKELTDYFEGKRQQFLIPFDLRGTSFQQSVWYAMCEIPFGQTRSYSDIAKRIENPKAVRAVGTAIGANPLSIVIPCHRVLGKGGTLTGYSGGLDVKEKLLKLEGILYKK